MEELKRCPFCGGEVLAEVDEYTNYGENEVRYVLTHEVCRDTYRCPIAHFQGESLGRMNFETESKAIKAWNTRV